MLIEAGVSKKKQLSLLRDGQKIVDRCMELDSNNFYSQKWAAVYLSALVRIMDDFNENRI